MAQMIPTDRIIKKEFTLATGTLVIFPTSGLTGHRAL